MALQVYSRIPPNNYWKAVKDYFNRGGFVNGLNPTIVGRIWYVNGEESANLTLNPHQGSDSNSGRSPNSPLATITRALALVDSYDVIVISGVFREQCVAPQDVFDVTIVGAANRPRQATDGGVATGGGSSWLAPAVPTATTPLLKLREQGWTLSNFMMAPVASSACVRVSRAEPLVTDYDASHATFQNMYFVGGGALGIGIEDVGGCGFVLIENCRFQALLDTAIKGISTGVAVPQGWIIQNNTFRGNLNDIKMSSNFGLIKENSFFTPGSGATNKVISTTFIGAQGGNNNLLWNQFPNTEAEIAPGSGYTGAATDNWMNYVNNQAALAFGQPA